MSKRLTRLLTLIGATAIIGTSVSFGYFYFGGHNTERLDSIQDLRGDSIYENYNSIQVEQGAKRLSDDIYTIYVFPSAYYLEIFDDAVNKGISSVMPEDLNGYLEPQVYDDGSFKFDENGKPILIPKNPDGTPKTFIEFSNKNFSAKNKKTYKADNYVKSLEEKYTVETRGDSYKKGNVFAANDDRPYRSIKKDGLVLTTYRSSSLFDKPYYSYISGITNKGALDTASDYYHCPDDFDSSVLRYYGEVAGYQKRIYNVYEHFENLVPYIGPVGYQEPRTYGHPDDLNIAPYLNENATIPSNLNITAKQMQDIRDDIAYDRGYDNQVCGKNLFSSDRFGYWRDYSLEEGRFMPIKISVRNTISPQNFAKIIGDVGISINDGYMGGYFEPEFADFVYALKGNMPIKDDVIKYLTKPNEPHARDVCTSYNVGNIFDISSSLDQYCDENNVIRLFPTFGAGKGYHSKELVNDTNLKNDALIKQKRRMGGKDAVRATIYQYDGVYSETSQPNLISSKRIFPGYYFKNVEIGRVANPNDKKDSDWDKIYLLSLNNIPINILRNNMQTHTRIVFESHLSEGESNWSGNVSWTKFYDLNFTDILNSPQFKELNGSAVYNFYLFYGNSGKATDRTMAPLSKFITNDSWIYGNFPILDSKRLLPITKNIEITDPALIDAHDYIDYNGAKDEKNRDVYGTFQKTRPVKLYAQKATEPKIYKNLDGNGQVEDIQKAVDRAHDTADTGFHGARPFFTKNGPNNYSRVYESKTMPGKNDVNVYMFKAVDFTTCYNNFMQLRWGNYANDRIGINLTGNNKYNSLLINLENVNTPPTDETAPVKFLELHKAFKSSPTDPTEEFFKFVKKGDSFTLPGDGTSRGVAKMNFLQLKDDTCRGIYDIVLAFNDNLTNAPGQTQYDAIFDVYVHRHTNIFIKLFEEKLDHLYNPTLNPNNPKAFIQHEFKHLDTGELDIDHPDFKYAKKQLWEKRYYIGDDIEGLDENEFKPALGNPDKNYNPQTLESVCRSFIKQNSTKYNYQNFIVCDQITDMPVVWFKPKEGKFGSTLPEDYVLFTNTSFRVYKNYCFYITTMTSAFDENKA